MIEYRVGDLLEQKDLHAIVHQCNCFHTMGTGIAKSLKIKWPEVYEADKKTKYGDESKLGSFSKAVVENGKLWVYNMYSQFGYGRDGQYTEYEMVERGLRAINLDLNTPRYYDGGLIKIGIPFKMGCNNAGGNWDYVTAILEDIYDSGDDIDMNYKLIICKKEWGD